MSGRGPSWFEKKRAASIRPTAWRGAPTPPPGSGVSLNRSSAAPGHDDAPELEAALLAPPPALSLEIEARRMVEEALAATQAELAEARAALEGAAHEVAELRAEVQKAREELTQFADAAYQGAERELVSLAVAIARRVVARELATSPDLIVGWAREAIAGSGFGKRVVVALSPDVAACLQPSAWGDLEPAIVVDASLAEGTVELRDDARTITTSAEERTELVAAKVVDVTDRTAA